MITVSRSLEGPYKVENIQNYAKTLKSVDIFGVLFYFKNEDKLYQVTPLRYLHKKMGVMKYEILELNPQTWTHNDGLHLQTNELTEDILVENRIREV